MYLNCPAKSISHVSEVQGPITCFVAENIFYVANLDGKLYRCHLDVSTSELMVDSTFDMLDPEEREVVQEG
jgi:hypothetical protein